MLGWRSKRRRICFGQLRIYHLGSGRRGGGRYVQDWGLQSSGRRSCCVVSARGRLQNGDGEIRFLFLFIFFFGVMRRMWFFCGGCWLRTPICHFIDRLTHLVRIRRGFLQCVDIFLVILTKWILFDGRCSKLRWRRLLVERGNRLTGQCSNGRPWMRSLPRESILRDKTRFVLIHRLSHLVRHKGSSWSRIGTIKWIRRWWSGRGQSHRWWWGLWRKLNVRDPRWATIIDPRVNGTPGWGRVCMDIHIAIKQLDDAGDYVLDIGIRVLSHAP